MVRSVALRGYGYLCPSLSRAPARDRDEPWLPSRSYVPRRAGKNGGGGCFGQGVSEIVFQKSCFRNRMNDSAETLQRLHDSEINAELSWFYDCGWRWRIGDNLNGCGGADRADRQRRHAPGGDGVL
jgi:hypothetical protein